MIKLAIVGCGAVSELSHIPIALASEEVEISILVDKNIQRIKELVHKFDINNISDDYRQVIGKVDAAILAVPHHLHAPMAIDLLKNGIHLLVEKPMALTLVECNSMVSAAEQGGAILAVGLVRRFLYSHQFVKKIISDNFLGKIKSFDVSEGYIYSWPVASDFFFKKETGGGVLNDTGAHTLDSILWWLGDYDSFEYYDDSQGGVDANCKIYLVMKNGAKGTIELSRTRNLRNSAIIYGEKTQLEVQMLGSQVAISPSEENIKMIGNVVSKSMKIEKIQPAQNIMKEQFKDWISAIKNKKKPYVSGKEASKSIAFIEDCHKNCQPLVTYRGGVSLREENEEIKLKGKKIFVTGGTGFIGSHLVEHLVTKYSADVHVLVRNFTRASRISRFPVKMFQGNILDKTTIANAMKGCEYVFHCAYGNTGSSVQQKEVNIKGTENVLEESLRQNVKRVVHMSTISVYGETKDGDLNELSPRRYSKEVYGDSKLEAEKIALYYFKKFGLPVSIIQPTIVYGPFAPSWTIGPINKLKKGRIILVEDGKGLCNAVFIEDVIQALILVAVKEKAIGEIFLISAEEPVTWCDFYKAYEKMISDESTISMNLDEIRKFNKIYREERKTINQIKKACKKHPNIVKGISNLTAVNRFCKIVKTIVPESILNRIKENFIGENEVDIKNTIEKPIFPLTQREINFYSAKTYIKIDKAKKILGYQPKYDLNQGMKLTKDWLHYANII